MENVGHAFESVVAVEDFSLAIEPGELVCLVGPSGCGKTTLLRIAAGLETLQQGSVRINGRVVGDSAAGVDVPPDERGVGLVFQDFALFPHLSVLNNVCFGLKGLPAARRRQRGLEVLRRVGMESYVETYPHRLSGGEQQRVALARALAPEPRLMLLDEPFSGLDARLRDQIRDETLHILKDSGTGTLIVTHDADEAMFMADRIAVMREGRIVQVGDPVDIYCAPVDAFVAAFFGVVNRLAGVIEQGAVTTPFGRVNGGTYPDGTEVEVLIRPEALIIRALEDDEEPESAAKVIASRMLGRSSLIHLCLGDVRDAHLHFHSRMPGRMLPEEDDIVGVRLDLSQTFVFPAADNK